MKISRVLGVGVAAAALLVGALGTAPAEAAGPALQITRVYVNAPGKDTSSNSSVNGEYVRIQNKTKKAVSLKGYTLRDQQKHVYTFGVFTLKAGKTVEVHTGKGSNSSSKRFMGRGWHIWNNDGHDSATLRNAKGAKIGSCAWGATSSYKTC